MEPDKNVSIIVRETANLLISNDFDGTLRFSTAKEGFYGLLSTKLKGIYSNNEANRLKKAFNRNSWKYKDLVNNIMNNTNFEKTEIFLFTNFEWETIVANHSSKKKARSELLIGFHDILAQKLQERGNDKFLNFYYENLSIIYSF